MRNEHQNLNKEQINYWVVYSSTEKKKKKELLCGWLIKI